MLLSCHFIKPFISLLKIINVVKPDPNIFLRTAASVADAVVVNPDCFKTLLAFGLSTFPIKGKPVFSNGSKSLPKTSLDCTILYNWVFESSILADEPFATALWIFETCVLVNNNFCEKCFSSLESPKTFDEWLKFDFKSSDFSSVFYSRF